MDFHRHLRQTVSLGKKQEIQLVLYDGSPTDGDFRQLPETCTDVLGPTNPAFQRPHTKLYFPTLESQSPFVSAKHAVTFAQSSLAPFNMDRAQDLIWIEKITHLVSESSQSGPLSRNPPLETS